MESRRANIRAGYVYVISNIGAFGDRVVKIGMTRRLEPLERIHELSGAAVPFRFDVHALIFSNDAVGLETELHRHFAAQRVNKVNNRNGEGLPQAFKILGIGTFSIRCIHGIRGISCQ
ncbi:GIY-YIG nuclease family protein [Streptomyces sp. NPDC002812]|uniref:GIY-YIG nuclease family protein n=1 Tax=Streptomyces sp. NPDC002812 TaxID=3154434 RepID=UPI003329AA8D